MSRRRVAVIGAGISGLSAARALTADADVTVFEREPRAGGHACTIDMSLHGISAGVDIGFLVFNSRTYPGLIALFDELGVDVAPSDMSFSVQSGVQPGGGGAALEWCGSNLDGVFAQRRNLVSPRFLGMLADLLRFNRLTTALAARGDEAELRMPLAEFLDRHRFGPAFRNDYLLPMIACIWSCPTQQMLRFPVATLIRFCHNHGLLQITDRPQWMTVRGGSRHYVERITRGLADVRLGCPVRGVQRLPPGEGRHGVRVRTDAGSERFDAVVFACHAPQALALLEDAAPAERRVLRALRTQPNRAVLHTDARLLPQRRRAWAAWNYERGAASADGDRVCLHYLINHLQPLPWETPVVVSLNPLREPDPATVVHEAMFDHPVFDLAAIDAQAQLAALQGRGGVYFCGAWARYGFHEDGLQSALAVAHTLKAGWAAGATGAATEKAAA